MITPGSKGYARAIRKLAYGSAESWGPEAEPEMISDYVAVQLDEWDIPVNQFSDAQFDRIVDDVVVLYNLVVPKIRAVIEEELGESTDLNSLLRSGTPEEVSKEFESFDDVVDFLKLENQ